MRRAIILFLIFLIAIPTCPFEGSSAAGEDNPFMRKIPLVATFEGQTHTIGMVQVGVSTLAEMEKMLEAVGIFEGPHSSGANFVYTKTKMRTAYGANESEDLCLDLQFDSKSFFFTENVLTSAYIGCARSEFTTAEGFTMSIYENPNENWFDEMVSVYGTEFRTESVAEPSLGGTRYFYDGIMFRGTFGWEDSPDPVDMTESLSGVFYSIGYCHSQVEGAQTIFAATAKIETDDIMRLAIFPTGTSEETYYFVLRQDGVLFCAIGSREGDEIVQPNFLRRMDSSIEMLLVASDFQCLIDLSDELEASCYNSLKHEWEDSWDVALLYNGKIYEMNYWHNDNSEAFTNLVNKIIELSPIPVDLHGWA